MLVEFGRANLLEKARAQPERVRQVLDKIATDGFTSTLDAVRSKLGQPLALGYCNVGRVTEIGADAGSFAIGDRVASNGPHAESVVVPHNLCARVPDSVSDEEAAFTVIGAIGLQGVRLAAPTLGECFVVIGLGLVGLITVQLLRANGCRVLGIDPDSNRLGLAQQLGAEVAVQPEQEPERIAERFSRGRGVDGVLVTASTKSSEPIAQAARMCRKRGRIVLVGVTGLELSRADFYEKELTFQVSCSYGPGRYDPAYEELGQDYPVGFVRWTEQRNFEAVLDMMARRQLNVLPLITQRFAFDDALGAYELLVSGAQQALGIMLEYAGSADSGAGDDAVVALRDDEPSAGPAVASPRVSIGAIGAGNYAGRVLLPALAALDVSLAMIASNRGVTASHVGKKLGFALATTDIDRVLENDQINAVIVATRHDSHAQLVCRALDSGKHVFVEKPLALTMAELDEIEAAQRMSGRIVCVGFNRRFAPLTQRARERVQARSGPLAIVITVNAGDLPAGHWTRDPRVGGGRIVGEACHFIDLARFLAGHPIASLQLTPAATSGSARVEDVSAIQLGFDDGTVASIQYLANGHPRFPKERIELFWDGKVLRIDNFRKLEGWGVPGAPSWGFSRQDKGHAALLAAFVDAIRGRSPAPIPMGELLDVSRWSIKAGSLALGKPCP